jgi:hypothetical protein
MPSAHAVLLFTASAGTGLAYVLYDRLSTIRYAQCFQHATVDHIKSRPMALMNPLGYPTQQDSYSLRIPVHKLKHGIGDEEILARFTYGYFGGWIFMPERSLITVFKPSITDLSCRALI